MILIFFNFGVHLFYMDIAIFIIKKEREENNYFSYGWFYVIPLVACVSANHHDIPFVFLDGEIIYPWT